MRAAAAPAATPTPAPVVAPVVVTPPVVVVVASAPLTFAQRLALMRAR